MSSRSRRSRAGLAGLALLAVTAATALAHIPATAADGGGAVRPGTSTPVVITPGDSNLLPGLPDLTGVLGSDGKPVVLRPSAAQQAAADALGRGTEVLWNASGTPASVHATDGRLAPASAYPGTPAEAARAYLVDHADLVGLPAAQLRDPASLELVSTQPFAGSAARAVLFRQKFGNLVAATRSMVTVGVGADGDIVGLTSSLTKASGPVPTALLSPLQGWLAAATDVGRTGLVPSAISVTSSVAGGWTSLQVPGFDQPQLARLRAVAQPDGTVRPVIEADVVDTTGGSSFAYRVLVDAVTKKVLFRQNAVENSSNAFQFQGFYTATGCGTKHPFTLTDANTKTIVAGAAAIVATDDIVVNIFDPAGKQLATADTATSPEVATASSTSGFPAGVYSMQVCPFGAGSTTPTLGGPYTAFATTSDTGASAPSLQGTPRWRAFAANPSLASVAKGTVPANTIIECWFAATTGCTPGETHQSTTAFGPWDQIGLVPTSTTIGNNANTHEAWASPLTPGGLLQAPVSPTRQYTGEFTDAWNESGCNPMNLTPGGNDINAVTTNLFTGHNRIHDFSYALGFTEQNYNLQLDNGGRGGTGGDQEIGNVQAGAAVPATDPTGALPVSGRDNANQIALQDGVPGITNQYLFQPLAGAFYSPCTDGALDTGIYGHEYTHAISNRMVGGPDDGLTSEQGGAMGESWSDLNAAEYQFENDYATGTNPWSLGSYTTGNFTKGIRDYAINDNPLNYSDYGFDTTGAEVHADGEIWNGTLWEVRQAMVDKWNAAYPYTDKALQDRCATPTAEPTKSQPSADQCPGNRRWLQLIYDAWLLQPGDTDMLQARNAMLMADQMRFGGADQAVIASAFARRGMGVDAVTTTPEDGGEDVTTPSFKSAFGNNSAVTFAPASGTPGWKVFVGDYEARATPVATAAAPSATFTPGIYKMTYVSPTQGFRRFVMTVPDSGSALAQPIDDAAVNLASAAAGASVIGSTPGSLNAASLIDGTEATNWGGVTTDNVDVSQPYVSVDLKDGLQTVTSVKVSALLNPAPADPGALPLLAGSAQADDDPASGSRFTALRQFRLDACTSACETPGAVWKPFYTSAADAFPADIPRPVAPDQTLRSFAVPATQAAAVRLVTLQNQCTGQAKYAGEQDQDPLNDTDCKTASDRGTIVHAAELQVFGQAVPTDPAPGTPGTGVPGSGTAGQGTGALPQPGQPSLGTSTAGTTTPATKPVARTRVRIRLPRVQQVKGKESTPMTFAVVAPVTSGGVKAGRAVIKLDGKKVKKTYGVQVTLKSGKKVVGKTFKVPTGLAYGRHTLQVFFKPFDSRSFTKAKSRKIVLTVVRTRPNAG